MWRNVKMQKWSYCLRVWYYYSIVLRVKYKTFHTAVAEFRLLQLGERFAECFSHGLETAENKNSTMVHAQRPRQSWPFRCLSCIHLRLQPRVTFKTDEENHLRNKGSDLTIWEIPFSLKLIFCLPLLLYPLTCTVLSILPALERHCRARDSGGAERSCGWNQPLTGYIRWWKCSTYSSIWGFPVYSLLSRTYPVVLTFSLDISGRSLMTGLHVSIRQTGPPHRWCIASVSPITWSEQGRRAHSREYWKNPRAGRSL